MYTLAILTQSDEVMDILDKHNFDNVYFSDDDDAWKYEIIFYDELNLVEKESVFKYLLDDYDDTIVWSYEQEEETDDPFSINYYDEYGLKESDFY